MRGPLSAVLTVGSKPLCIPRTSVFPKLCDYFLGDIVNHPGMVKAKAKGDSSDGGYVFIR